METLDLGRQHEGDDEFKARMRLHQSVFRAKRLNAGWKAYGNRLGRSAALAGKNFHSGYPDIFRNVCSRYPLKYVPLYYDMLRSQHIPWNMFAPLQLETDFAVPFVVSLLNTANAHVIGIRKILIEHAPKPRERFLADNTSHDVYLELIDRDKRIHGFGIEIKFTEHSYPYGAGERRAMQDPHSRYNTVNNQAKLYKKDSLPRLGTQRLKQMWRNQLLGETMLRDSDLGLDTFTLVVLQPEGNEYCIESCRRYADCIKDDQKSKFVQITFERFVQEGRRFENSLKIRHWLDYVEERYIGQ